MSIILNVMNNMSDEDKARLGRSGTKINTDGSHLVTITEAYEIDNQRFCLTVEDAEGKTANWTGFFKQKVGKDDKGVVKSGEYSVNGVKTFLDTEGACESELVQGVFNVAFFKFTLVEVEEQGGARLSLVLLRSARLRPDQGLSGEGGRNDRRRLGLACGFANLEHFGPRFGEGGSRPAQTTNDGC